MLNPLLLMTDPKASKGEVGLAKPKETGKLSSSVETVLHN